VKIATTSEKDDTDKSGNNNRRYLARVSSREEPLLRVLI